VSYYDPQIEVFVSRLWQFARLRALGAPEEILQGGRKLIAQSVAVLPLRGLRQELNQALGDHIISQTRGYYETKGEGPDASACERLAMAVRLLDGVYGLQADKVIAELIKLF
jgi:hypothetical protein